MITPSATSSIRQKQKFWQLGIVLCGAMLVGFGILYLHMLNSLSTKGFGLEQLKITRLEKQREKEAVDIKMAMHSSLYNLESTKQIQNMATITDKVFLHVNGNQVAYRVHETIN